ncbi:MAG: hypothetical protein ACRD1Z_06425 [Vicinamibacteria bacterium]
MNDTSEAKRIEVGARVRVKSSGRRGKVVGESRGYLLVQVDPKPGGAPIRPTLGYQPIEVEEVAS